MKVHIQLFGALREAAPGDRLELEVADDATIGMLREALQHHLSAAGSAISPNLVQRSAFASDEEILHNGRRVPADGVLAVLPPVSGG